MAACLITKENLYLVRFRYENTNMILAIASVLYGYLHLRSCRGAEASYRATVAHRLEAVCG